MSNKIVSRKERRKKNNTITLDKLPAEIIEQILSCNVITYIDLCHLCCTSRFFSSISKDDELWRMKYYQKWPSMIQMDSVQFGDTFYFKYWKIEFQQRILFGRAIRQKLSDISQELYYIDKVSTDSFSDFSYLCGNHLFSDYILVGELEDIVYHSNKNENLTIKYYAERALAYARQTVLDLTWCSLLDVNEDLSLLKGACLIQQWCNPVEKDCTKEISQKVNELIKLVFNEVIKVCPTHPVIKKQYSTIADGYSEIIKKSLWSPYHCKVIINCINDVLFNKLSWKAIHDSSKLNHLYINEVLDTKVGDTAIIAVIFETIATHLGVQVVPVQYADLVFLKFLETPGITQVRWVLIDLTENGKFAFRLDVLSEVKDLDAMKVFSKILWRIVNIGRGQYLSSTGITYLNYSLELINILEPDNMEFKRVLCRAYMDACVNLTRVISLLQEIAENDRVFTGSVAHMYALAVCQLEIQNRRKREKYKRITKRSEILEDIKFSVGMVMHHKKYNYRCVIFGWDPVSMDSRSWFELLGVGALEFKQYQPFYNVLICDGYQHYAAQENLEVDGSGLPVTHKEVGRYFESFHGTYYSMNQNKKLEYPEDEEFLNNFNWDIHKRTTPLIN